MTTRSIKAFIVLSCLASSLTACVIEQPRLAKDMPNWGNYKCVSVSPIGEHFTGWSVYHAEAKENALAICHEATKESGCRIDSCRNDVVKKHKVIKHRERKEKSHHFEKHR